MGTASELTPATSIFSQGTSIIGDYAFVLFIFVVLAVIIGGIFIYKTFQKKKKQWTHKLRIRRVLLGNEGSKKLRLSGEMIILMRRFPLIKKAEVFELEKPLLGGYLLPELDQYSGENEFSIILDVNNRIYTNQGEFFDPDKNCVNVSAKHSEIDIGRATLKADFQNINKTTKRVDWGTIAKYAFMVIFIVCIMILGIVAIQNWGEAQAEKANAEKAQAIAMENMASAMVTIESVVNTQKLEILPMMKEIYGTQNIQGIINRPYNETI